MYSFHIASKDRPALWEQSSLNPQAMPVVSPRHSGNSVLSLDIPCRRTGKCPGTSRLPLRTSQFPVLLSPPTTAPARHQPLSHLLLL